MGQPMKKNKKKEKKQKEKPSMTVAQRRKYDNPFPNRLSGIPRNYMKMNVPRETRLSLHQCTLKYAVAVADPFNMKARGACIPIDSGSSMKATGIHRADFVSMSTSGLIYICPTVASDAPCVFYTQTGWLGTTTPFLTIGSATSASTLNTGWAYAFCALPFDATQCLGPAISSGSTVESKIVSCGVRISYTGKELEKGGVIYCYHDPSHNTVSRINGSNIGQLADASLDDVSRTPCTLSMYGVQPAENSFTQSQTETTVASAVQKLLYPYSGDNELGWLNASLLASLVYSPIYPNSVSLHTGNNFTLGAPIAVIQYSTGGSALGIHMEIVTHCEYQGPPAASLLTPNASDIQGVNMVKSAAARLPALKNSKEPLSMMALMSSALAEVAKAATPIAVRVGGSLLEVGAKAMLDLVI